MHHSIVRGEWAKGCAGETSCGLITIVRAAKAPGMQVRPPGRRARKQSKQPAGGGGRPPRLGLADHAQRVRVDQSGGYQVQFECLITDRDGMTGVVAAGYEPSSLTNDEWRNRPIKAASQATSWQCPSKSR